MPEQTNNGSGIESGYDYTPDQKQGLETHLNSVQNRLNMELGFYHQQDTKASITLAIAIAVLTAIVSSFPYNEFKAKLAEGSDPFLIVCFMMLILSLVSLIVGSVFHFQVIFTNKLNLPDMELERKNIQEANPEKFKEADYANWISSNYEDALKNVKEATDKKVKLFKLGIGFILVGAIVGLIFLMHIRFAVC